MARPLHTLYVTGPPGATFRVTDGASQCVATGMYRLVLELPQGIYTVNATLGRSVETREVLLDESRTIELQSSMPSFGDHAFWIAPEVIVALGNFEFRAGGQLIALRGPWRDEQAAQELVELDRDGAPLAAARQGFVPDPRGQGVWSWQLFDLASQAMPDTGAPGLLSVRRAVSDTPLASDSSPPDAAAPNAPLRKVSHVLPHWGDWVAWAAYPATVRGAYNSKELPPAYYLRLRLTLPGAVPDLHLQSLSDQIFTALAARTGLPLSKPVLDLLLLSDEADPLLVLAAAHLASITLGWLRRELPRLPQDASPSAAPVASSELQFVDADSLQQRFGAWLEHRHEGALAGSPDMVAARFLFGIGTQVHLRAPPVLLRSLDGLLASAESSGITCADTVWSMRMQLSDSFAFLQWQPDADYQQLLSDSMSRSLEGTRAVASAVRFIEQSQERLERKERQERDIAASRSATGKPQAGRRAARRIAPRAAAAAPSQRKPTFDIEDFIKNNAASLRIPAAALLQALDKSTVDQGRIEAKLQHWVLRLKKVHNK